MPKIEGEIEFEVWCSCGAGLCGQTIVKGTSVTIEPCEACLSKAREEAKEEGDEEGYERGLEDGRKEVSE